jgi:hypothetical protein
MRKRVEVTWWAMQSGQEGQEKVQGVTAEGTIAVKNN